MNADGDEKKISSYNKLLLSYIGILPALIFLFYKQSVDGSFSLMLRQLTFVGFRSNPLG